MSKAKFSGIITVLMLAGFLMASCGTETDWVSVSAGEGHTVAIRADGTLWAWGRNESGQLGVGGVADSVADHYLPTQIGAAMNWISVSAGGSHTVAIRADGTLWAWGRNTFGQLGIGQATSAGTSHYALAPVQIGTTVGGAANCCSPWCGISLFSSIGTAMRWSSVSAGGSHNLAVATDGTLWAWGDNRHGQLGDGSRTNRHIPAQIGADADWAYVSAGNVHSAAIKKDGTLWTWGVNNWGQLGDGTTDNRQFLAKAGTDADWASVSVGGWHTAAIKTDGSLWVWGYNGDGQLGDGTAVNRHSPVRIGEGNDWVSVYAGNGYTIAIRRGGTLWAWGRNDFGQLGEDVAANHGPARIGRARNWASVSAGMTHAAAVRTNGRLWAWGRNDFGQLGISPAPEHFAPIQVGP